jgi:hypothetical protein
MFYYAWRNKGYHLYKSQRRVIGANQGFLGGRYIFRGNYCRGLGRIQERQIFGIRKKSYITGRRFPDPGDSSNNGIFIADNLAVDISGYLLKGLTH